MTKTQKPLATLTPTPIFFKDFLWMMILKVFSICVLCLKSISYIHSLPQNDVQVPITIVVSHCKQSLEWLSSTIDDLTRKFPNYAVTEVVIYSKCGRKVIGAPKQSTITPLPNVGRCDHTYAHYISKEMKLTEGIVLFLKDTRHVYWEYKVKSESKNLTEGLAFVHDYGDMIQRALSPTEFCCRQYINSQKTGIANAVITKILLTWFREEYSETQNMYALNSKDETPFSVHTNMLQWVTEMGVQMPKPLTSVCYGGVFAVSVKRLREIDPRVWDNLRVSLSRGNNIQEGHFMERTWYVCCIMSLCLKIRAYIYYIYMLYMDLLLFISSSLHFDYFLFYHLLSRGTGLPCLPTTSSPTSVQR